MRRTKEEAEVTRQKLLKSALEVFGRKGYVATRLDDVAKHANVTTGAIYHHFGGKSQLYIELVEESSKRVNQLAMKVMEEGGSPLAKLKRFLIWQFEYAEEDEQYRAVVELAFNNLRVSPEIATIMEQTITGRHRLVEFFAQLIEEGIHTGEIRAEILPQDAALALVGFMNGVGLIWLQDPQYFSIKESAERFVDLFFEGMSSK